MKKKLIKFLITISILLTTFNTNILAQNRISGEKLEKLLIENHIIIYDFRGPLINNIELNFNEDKTYKLQGVFPYSEIYIHPSRGTWEIVGFGKSSVMLNDIKRIQLLFGDDGNIYDLNQKLYSYRLENKKERIENNARKIEEERKAEELRLKKIEEEKKQLAIKREQERIKAEKIKKEEEKKRLELAEWAKKEEEAKIKRDNEERIKLERDELYKNILKYSLISIFLSILSFFIYKYRTRIKDEFYPKFIKFFKNLKSNGKEFYPKFIEYVKDIKTNSDKKLGITIIGVCFFVVILLVTSLSGNKSSTSSQKSYGRNACDGVADHISRYIQYPQRNSNINALRNYYNEAKDLSRSFNSDPQANTNYCASILNAAAKEFLP